MPETGVLTRTYFTKGSSARLPRRHMIINATLQYIYGIPLWRGGDPSGVMKCDNVVSEFELQSRYYVHFRTNTFE